MNFRNVVYLCIGLLSLAAGPATASSSPSVPIDYSWLEGLPLYTYGRVLIGDVGSMLNSFDRESTDGLPEVRGRVGFLARKKTSDWILTIELSDPEELQTVLTVLSDAGATRFNLLAELPSNGPATGEVVLPQPPSPENSAFGFVNHGRSFAWGKTPVSALPTVRTDLGRAYVTFFEARSGLETTLIEASGIATLRKSLVSVIQKSPDPLNQKAIPPSFGICTAQGTCLGDRVIVGAGKDLRRGRVLGIGFPGAHAEQKVSLQIAVEGPGPSEHRFSTKHHVAQTKAGICWPVLSDFCVGGQVQARGKVPLKIAGVLLHSEDLILEDEGGNLHRTPRREVQLVPFPAAPATPLDLSQRLIDPVLRLQDLLVEWTPKKGPPGTESFKNPWAECTNPRLFGHPLRVGDDGSIDPRCAPDTLYSWTSLSFVDQLAVTNGRKSWKDLITGDSGIYFSATPASTFAYGAVDESGGYALRMKLKPGVKFRFVEFDPGKLEPPGAAVPPTKGSVLREFPKPVCTLRPLAEALETVYVRYWSFKSAPGEEFPEGLQDAGLEYIICSRSVLESWSFGTREFYDELVRDVRRFTMLAPPASTPSYIRRVVGGETTPIILDILTDEHPFTQQHLINVLRRHFVMGLRKEGKVFVNPELGRPALLERRHFQTKLDSWFSAEAR